jgi:hypothetical protein
MNAENITNIQKVLANATFTASGSEETTGKEFAQC